MTTRVTVACPDNSHWALRVITEDKVYDHEKKVMTVDWKQTGEAVVLQPTGSLETYLTSSRRLVIEEGDPVS